MSAAKKQVATRLLPADHLRVLALVPDLPESMRGRVDPTEADALRLCILRGLAWVEANGTEAIPEAIPEARTVTKRTTARRARR